MTPNRIVAFLTPLVFAPAAGWAASWLAKHAPGVDIKESDLQSIFIAGAVIGLAPALQWLHGWQKHEARQADAEHQIELATVTGQNAPTLAAAPDDGGLDLAALEGLDAGDGLEGLDDLDVFDESDLEDDLDDGLLAEPAAIQG